MIKLLEEEYKKLENKDFTYTGKSNVLNNIVQIKLSETELYNYKNHISVDIKKYLISIIEVAELGPIKYDEIRERKIIELLNKLENKEKLYYLNFLIRQLQKSSFEDEIKTFQKIRIKTILENSKNDFMNFRSILNVLVYFPLYSLFTLFITLFTVALISGLILMPAQLSWMSLFDFKLTYLGVCNNYFFNHFINVFSSLLGVNEDFKIRPNDEFSMIALMIGKIFLFLYVLVFIFNKLSDYLKR
ncbi:hypothetical protein GCM10008015_19180 [Flavobacterium palustre]|uniref:Uncharacterized protein n=1 Tax=Flavobacterium palustre TaxID=1476463 RepID=A0ABQ1HIZ0_9FLAO|nr:hypothetical protein [Flavobacterium palustre]GGA78624.1 hypothetical protein GCM10008015_19180 [Flavobacterium palustre]